MITKDNNLRVMEWFFTYPTRSFHIRELARLTGLSSTGIIKIVQKLKKEQLLISTKGKTTEEITPNTQGKYPLLKKLYNEYSISNTGLLNKLDTAYERPEAIILFGSYAKGEDVEKSDIDIAILTKKKTFPDLKTYEKKLSRPITLHLVNLTKASEEFKNSLANGTVLKGFLEVTR